MINIIELIEQFPIYKKHFESIDANTTSLACLPDLDKRLITHHFPKNWTNPTLEHAIKNDVVEYKMTSGTSGDRMQLVRRKNWWMREYESISHTHHLLYELYGKNKRKATLTTAICSNTVCFRENPTLEKRTLGNSLHLNYAHCMNTLSYEDVQRIIDEYNHFSPYNLDADPIYLTILLKLKEKYGIIDSLHQPGFISLAYEFCPAACYQYIQKYFDVPIMRMYGSTELGYLYYSLNDEDYQIFPELIQPKFIPYPGLDHVFELVITSLKNEYMPFINYKTGDLVYIDKSQQALISTDPCKVKIKSIVGRVQELVQVQSGAKITTMQLDELMCQYIRVIYYQLEAFAEFFQLQYVTFDDKPLQPEQEACLKKQLMQRFKSCKILLHHVYSIAPAASGKYVLMHQG